MLLLLPKDRIFHTEADGIKGSQGLQQSGEAQRGGFPRTAASCVSRSVNVPPNTAVIMRCPRASMEPGGKGGPGLVLRLS